MPSFPTPPRVWLQTNDAAVTATFEPTGTATLTMAISPADQGSKVFGKVLEGNLQSRYFRISGNVDMLQAGAAFTIAGSPGNDGTYISKSSSSDTDWEWINTADPATKTLTIWSDYSAYFFDGFTFAIVESSDNDGTYTAAGVATYDSVTDLTSIVVKEAIPSAMADGYLAMNYGYVYVQGEVPSSLAGGSVSSSVVGCAAFSAQGAYGTTGPVSQREWYDIVATSPSNPANGDYQFDQWQVSGNAYVSDSQSASASVFLTGDATVTALYTVKNTEIVKLTLDVAAASKTLGGNLAQINDEWTLVIPFDKASLFPPYTYVMIAGSTNNDGIYQTYDNAVYGAEGIGPVMGVDPAAKTFSVDGDQTRKLISGVAVTISGSMGNNGTYTVAATASYDQTANTTTVTVAEAIPDATVDGDIAYGATTIMLGDGYLDPSTIDGSLYTIQGYPVSGSHQGYVCFEVKKGEKVDITGHSLPGYKFQSWSASENATLVSTTAQNSIVTLSGDATVTAAFVPAATTATCVITVASDPVVGGSTSDLKVGINTVPVGSWKTVTANPVSGFRFVKWVASDTAALAILDPLSQSTSVLPVAATTLTAVFQADPVTTTCLAIAVSPAQGGTELVRGIGSYVINKATSYEIEAAPNAGFRFMQWQKTGECEIADAYSADTTVRCVGPATVTAVFQAITSDPLAEVTVIVQPAEAGEVYSDDGGWVSPTDTWQQPTGFWFGLSAYPNGDWTFDGWTTQGGATVAGPKSNHTYYSLSAPGVMVANFVKKTVPDPVTLTVAGTPATLRGGLEINGESVEDGASIQPRNEWFGVAAYPVDEAIFTGWTATGAIHVLDPNSAETSIILTGDATLVANFASKNSPKSATLTVAVAPGVLAGNATMASGGSVINVVNGLTSTQVSQGTLYYIEANPGYGYKFVGWVSSGAVIVEQPESGSTNFQVSGDASLTALFEVVNKAAVTLAVTPDKFGTVNWNDDNPTYAAIETGTWMSITAQPAGTPYRFVKWTISGAASFQTPAVDATNASTRVFIAGDATITAEFKTVEFTEVGLSLEPAYAGFPNGDLDSGVNTVVKGDVINVGVASNPGYEFVSWDIAPAANFTLVDSTIYDSNLQMIATGPVSAVANFKELANAKLTISGSPVDLGGEEYYGYGVKTVLANQWLPVAASAPNGYEFSSWSSSGNVTLMDVNSADTEIFVTGDAAITANYIPQLHGNAILQVTAAPGAGGDVFNYYNYYGGQSVLGANSLPTFTWIPLFPVTGSGYKFSGWTTTGPVKVKTVRGTGGATDERHYVWFEGDGTLTANFTPVPTAQLTVAMTPANAGMIADFGSLPKVVVTSLNEWNSILCQPYLGYRFVKWTASADVMLANAAQSATSYYMTASGTAGSTLTAELENVGTVAVTAACNPANGGQLEAAGIASQNGMNLVTKGAYYYVNARPAQGFVFSGRTVTGGVKQFAGTGGIDNGYFIADADGTITANFTATTVAAVTITASPAEGGYVDGSETGGGNDTASQFWTLKRNYPVFAGPFDGYRFVKWTAISGDVAFANPTHQYTTATVLSGTSAAIVAEFESIPTAQFTIASAPVQAMPYLQVAEDSDGECLGDLYYDYWDLGTRTVNANSTYLVRVNPQAGYRFTGWNVVGQANIVKAGRQPCESAGYASSFADRYFITVIGNATVTAQFAAKGTATLSLGTAPVDAGQTKFTDLDSDVTTWNPQELVYQDTAYRIEAMPAPGWYFSKWSIQGPATLLYEINGDYPSYHSVNSVYVSVTGDATVTAEYSRTPASLFLTLDVNNPSAGTVYPASGVYPVPYGVPVEIVADPVLDGEVYTFTKWTTSKDSAYVVAPLAVLTKVSITENTVVTANFSILAAGNLSMVSDPAGAGTASPIDFGSSDFLQTGEWHTVEATAKDGYAFVKWTGAGGITIYDTTAAKTEVLLTGDATMTATFKALPKGTLTVVVSPAGAGTTNPAAGVNTVSLGDLTLNATPAAGWQFVNWTVVSGSSTITCEAGKPLTEAILHMGGDTTLYANFTAGAVVRPVLTIGINPVGGGAIVQPNGGASSYKLLKGQSYAIEAKAAEGFSFIGWLTNQPSLCVIGDAGDSATMITLTGDATVTAMFSKKFPGAFSVRAMTCSLNSANPSGDTLSVTSAELLGPKVPDPRLGGTVTFVTVEGYQATIQASEWSAKGTVLTYGGSNLRVVIDLAQGTLQMYIKGVALSSLINSADGLTFGIYVGDQLFKGIAYPNEKSTWKYSSKSKTGITSIQGARTYTAGSTKPMDSMKITGYGLVMPAGFTTATIPTVWVDTMGIVANGKVTSAKNKFTYKSTSKAPTYTVILDFNAKKAWSLNLAKSFDGWLWDKSGTMTITVQYGSLGGDQIFVVSPVTVKSALTMKKK